MEKQYLIINVNGIIDNQSESYHLDLISAIAESHCNIEKINFQRIYNVLVGYILVSGKWNEVALLDKHLAKFLETNLVNIDIIRPEIKPLDETKDDKKLNFIPYEIKVDNIDEVGIINKFVDFLAFQDIEIDSLNANVYDSKYGSRLIKLRIKVKVPGDVNISSLREQFDIMCYDESFDATFKVASRAN